MFLVGQPVLNACGPLTRKEGGQVFEGIVRQGRWGGGPVHFGGIREGEGETEWLRIAADSTRASSARGRLGERKPHQLRSRRDQIGHGGSRVAKVQFDS